jgi:hypothetical protein
MDSSDWLEERAEAATTEASVAGGTYAERLARVGCGAEHALWALRHGADWRAAWSSCPRPDWLAEAFVLASCREGGGANHRRLVGWIGREVERAWSDVLLRREPDARARVERCTLAVRAATSFAIDWSGKSMGRPPQLVALTVSALFDPDEADWTADEAIGQRSTPDRRARAVAHAALRASCSALAGDCPGAALRALAWGLSWSDEEPSLARAFVEAFDCPEDLRCDLPA